MHFAPWKKQHLPSPESLTVRQKCPLPRRATGGRTQFAPVGQEVQTAQPEGEKKGCEKARKKGAIFPSRPLAAPFPPERWRKKGQRKLPSAPSGRRLYVNRPRSESICVVCSLTSCGTAELTLSSVRLRAKVSFLKSRNHRRIS